MRWLYSKGSGKPGYRRLTASGTREAASEQTEDSHFRTTRKRETALFLKPRTRMCSLPHALETRDAVPCQFAGKVVLRFGWVI